MVPILKIGSENKSFSLRIQVYKWNPLQKTVQVVQIKAMRIYNDGYHYGFFPGKVCSWLVKILRIIYPLLMMHLPITDDAFKTPFHHTSSTAPNSLRVWSNISESEATSPHRFLQALARETLTVCCSCILVCFRLDYDSSCSANKTMFKSLPETNQYWELRETFLFFILYGESNKDNPISLNKTMQVLHLWN